METNVGSPPIVRRTIMFLKIEIDAMAERFDLCPLFFGVRLGDTRRFSHACDLHRMIKIRFAFVNRSGDWRSAHGVGCGSQRYVSFAGQQSAGRIESREIKPATGQVDFRPRM